MQEYDPDYDDIPMSDVLQTIKMVALLPLDKKSLMQMTSALGVHMCKLQKEFGYPPVFPIDLIPLPKSEIKKWGFNYASLVVKKQGILKQFQQDGALYYTRFREMTESQWDALKSHSVENVVLYNAEMRDKKSSSLPITSEFKSIIDSYRLDYDSEVIELHTFIKNKNHRPLGCMIISFLLLIFNAILVWLLL